MNIKYRIILELLGIFILFFTLVFSIVYIYYNAFGWGCTECNVRVNFGDYEYDAFFNKSCDEIKDLNISEIVEVNTSIYQHYTLEKNCIQEGKDCYNWICKSEYKPNEPEIKLLNPSNDKLYSIALKRYSCSKQKEIKCGGFRKIGQDISMSEIFDRMVYVNRQIKV